MLMCVLSQIKTYYRKHNASRIVQGDILKEVKFSDWDWDKEKNNVKIYEKKLPYIVILTQDCDLDLDSKYRTSAGKNDDKILQSVLVRPAYGWNDFINGDHLKDYSLKMQTIKSDSKKNDIQNQQVPNTTLFGIRFGKSDSIIGCRFQTLLHVAYRIFTAYI